MSNINIRRAIENIRSSTTVFTPIVETVVNAIEAIEATGVTDGVVSIAVRRAPQLEIEASESRIVDVVISDNGIGFTQANRDSFDTLYSEYKIVKGGKGFGRFTCLKYFEDFKVDSIYFEGRHRRRSFAMGKSQEIIVDEVLTDDLGPATGTIVTLAGEKSGSLPRKLSTFARGLVEMLLPYFTTEGYRCPRIELRDWDDDTKIVLNDYLDSADAVIQEKTLLVSTFELESVAGPRSFRLRVFKILFPRNKVSKISLVAHRREVTETSLSAYVPEFAEEFFEAPGGDESRSRNYILKGYVYGDYLDGNVLLERGAFDFQKDSDVTHGISQSDIERAAAELTKAAVFDQVTSRLEKKRERLQSYVDTQAPWHRALLRSIDITSLPTSSTDSELDALLHREKYRQEARVKIEVAELLASEDPSEIKAKAAEIASRISETSKSELVHYIALRKEVLNIFRRSLEVDSEGRYASEGTVHDVIFPTKSDSESIPYEDHNLWILDERLTFTSYLASDLPLDGGNSQRPDLIAFDQRVAFRAENEAGNPVTIFEFKRPNRDDFANPSSREDPVQQIVRYVNSIRDGRFKTPQGRPVHIASATPFYGYVVCELTEKVSKWLRTEKNFTPMPDGLGWFLWFPNINLYVEVLSWEKLLRDADMRNRVFFHKLGIE